MKASTETLTKTTPDPLPTIFNLKVTYHQEHDTDSLPTTIRRIQVMDVEKQIMVIQDRATDLERRESAFENSMTGPESDESARPKLRGKQKLLIAIALIAASAVLVATTVMLALFGFEADRVYYNATGKPMSPDQRLVVDILGGTYFALYFIIIFISTHYHLTKHSLARLFWGFNLMSLTFMAFVEVVHYSIAFLAAEQAGKIGANI